MNAEPRNPPALACGFLRCFCAKRNREAITGDLIERFREGRSDIWFWRQVFSAILIGAVSRLKRGCPEVSVAAAGTVLIWFVPWGKMFPLVTIITSMNWSARFQWLTVINTMTAMIVLPFFVVLFRIRSTFGWAKLVQVFFISLMLFTLGDLPILWWNVSYPTGISRSQAIWAVPMMVGWIFARLLISARVAGRLPSPSRPIPT